MNEVMLIRERVSRIYFIRKFFDYPVALKWKTIKNMGVIRTIKVGFSYIKVIFFKRKERSLEDFYINRFGKQLYNWNMSDEDFINMAAEELIKMKIIEKTDILDSHREKIKKAYPAYFDTYSEIDKLINYLDKSNIWNVNTEREYHETKKQ